MYYIGVDLGTSSVKLLLTDARGNIRKTVSREYPLYFPQNGWSEQDPADWLRSTVDGIRELVAGYPADRVAGISFGGQMHGLVLLDARDRVIRPAILWNDGRTGAETAYLNTVIGTQTLCRYTGNIAFAGFTAPKLLWVRNNEPENFERIAKIMLPKDYLAYMLSGSFCTDVSDASGTLLLDVQHRQWSEEMLKICGIRKEQLPRVYESYETVGTLTAAAAQSLGLPQTVRVIAGAGDNAAAAIGTATAGNGACNISLGTSGTIFIASDSFRVDENNALHSFAHADGSYHLMGCMLSAASCSKWWCKDILRGEDFAAEHAGISALGENRVFFLPYLMGERSPHNDANVRAGFMGMSMDTTREEMTQAVLEGVAFGLRDSLEVIRKLGLSPSRTKLCGGGAKNLLWRRILANVLDLPLDIVEAEEGPAYGAAILAMVGCGEYSTVQEAAERIVRVKTSVLPEPELVSRYEQRYQTFRELYPAVKHLF